EEIEQRGTPEGPLFYRPVPTSQAQKVRIIAGAFLGRVVCFPRGVAVRPTADRVRETLFNWLGQDLTGWATLDLFAGSGALTLEALSRGAALGVATDRDRALTAALEATARAFGGTGLEADAAEARAGVARAAQRAAAWAWAVRGRAAGAVCPSSPRRSPTIRGPGCCLRARHGFRRRD